MQGQAETPAQIHSRSNMLKACLLVLGTLLSGCVAFTWDQLLNVGGAEWLDKDQADRAQTLWEITTAMPLYYLPPPEMRLSDGVLPDEALKTRWSIVYGAWKQLHVSLCTKLGEGPVRSVEEGAPEEVPPEVPELVSPEELDEQNEREAQKKAEAEDAAREDLRRDPSHKCSRGHSGGREVHVPTLPVPTLPVPPDSDGDHHERAKLEDRVVACEHLPVSMKDPCKKPQREYLIYIGCKLGGCRSSYCLAQMSFAGHEMEHIVGKKSKELFKDPPPMDILGNTVMTSARWNRAVGAATKDNAVQKILVYGEILSVAARYWITHCKKGAIEAPIAIDNLNFEKQPANTDWEMVCGAGAPAGRSEGKGKKT